MKILHYSLGFPPYRSGGLTKFSIDLIKQQNKEGHEVALLWPGELKLLKKKTKIKAREAVEIDGCLIKNFEIINPLPVSLDEGIKKVSSFIEEGDRDVFFEFLEKEQPDVIHIHSFMGLHKNFLSVAKQKQIRLVYTAHDFFPICPKATLFRNGKICDSAEECIACLECNANALSINKIKILQSPVYRALKNNCFVKMLRKKHRKNFLTEQSSKETKQNQNSAKDYILLRKYYQSMMQLMDIVHYNSTLTKDVYEKYFKDCNNCVISITHSDIINHKKIKIYSSDKIRVRYLGPCGEAKGFFYLRDTFDRWWKETQNIILDVHFSMDNEERPFLKYNSRYTYSELQEIFDNTDVVVVPSLGYETFGFNVIEALSYGVPVIVTNNVGAKDILLSGNGIVICNTENDELLQVLESLTKEKLAKMNESIVLTQKIETLEEVCRKIEQVCYCRE